jgi:4-hydroxy-tetrahydrodipicolinate reductase
MDIAVNGAAGAMGRRMVSLIAGAEDCRLVAALEREGHPQLGTDAGSLAGVRALGVPLSASFDVPAHVLVDFSSPEAAIACARRCAEKGLPLSSAPRASLRSR